MRFHLKYLLIYLVIIQSACEIRPFRATLHRSIPTQPGSLFCEAASRQGTATENVHTEH